MKLTDGQVEEVLLAVKKEPRTVQEIAFMIDKSWVTAEKYLLELKSRTGQIDLKTFRPGTQAALKIAYYVSTDSGMGDEVKKSLAQQIFTAKKNSDFDFMEVFQFIPERSKHSSMEPHTKEGTEKFITGPLLDQAQRHVYFLSGNLSFFGFKNNHQRILDKIEQLLQRGVHIKILSRINLSSMPNLEKVNYLLVKYPHLLEIHHRYHPLRGFIVDDKLAWFKTHEDVPEYPAGELTQKQRLFFEIHDPEWIAWLESIFWSMWRSSIDHPGRIKEIQKITPSS